MTWITRKLWDKRGKCRNECKRIRTHWTRFRFNDKASDMTDNFLGWVATNNALGSPFNHFPQWLQHSFAARWIKKDCFWLKMARKERRKQFSISTTSVALVIIMRNFLRVIYHFFVAFPYFIEWLHGFSTNFLHTQSGQLNNYCQYTLSSVDYDLLANIKSKSRWKEIANLEKYKQKLISS